LQFKGTRRLARFPPASWNLYERVLNCEPRTSNGIESWHCQLSNTVEASHPTLWKLIADLKNEMILSEQKIDRYNITGETSRRNKTYQKRDIDYKNRVLRYGRINNFDYLKTIAHCIVLYKNLPNDDDEEQ
jgi:hypothetical protein